MSITGHSLGGWLAQASLFYYNDDILKYKTSQTIFNIAAVTFDNPGAK